ncbi:MAG: energy transducer TonB [Bacteroidota bacterium]
MNDFAVSSSTLLIGLIGLCVLTLSVIFVMRNLLSKRAKTDWSDQKTSNSNVIGRNKYPAVNAFKWSNTFFMLSLTIALSVVFMAFNWTQYEEKIFIPYDISIFDEDLIQEPPRTTTPPPPLPPPPPVIEAVPEEEIEEEEIEFVDLLVEEETEIAPPPKPVVKSAPPTPPPAPPVIEEEEPIFVIVEDMPRFPGCKDIFDEDEAKKCTDMALTKFLYKNLKYPPIARENGIDGTCVVRFTIEKSGKVSGIELLRDQGGGLGAESVRVVKLMQDQDIEWRPGMQRGQPVRVSFTLPVKFKLQ